MEAVELQYLSRTINNAIGSTSREFREASRTSNQQLSRIVKDIYGVFAAQQNDISELTNAVEGSRAEEQQMAFRMERMSSHIQESISYLANMNAELKTLSQYMSAILDMESRILQNGGNITSGIGGLAAGIWGKFESGLVTLLKTAGIGAAAIDVAQTLSGPMGGGGGGGGGGGDYVPSKGGKNPVDPKEIYSYLTKEKGMDHAHAMGVIANIKHESRFDSGAKNPNDVNGPSGGLFQHHDNLRTGEHRFTDMTRYASQDGGNWSTNWKKQIDFALNEGEMKKFLSQQYGSGQDAARGFVYLFEKPRDKVGEAYGRAGDVAGLEKYIKNGVAAKAAEGPKSSPMSSDTPKAEGPKNEQAGTQIQMPHEGGEHGHGIMSGAGKEEKGNVGSLPHGDIVALGKALQGQGLKVAGHSAFPPVGTHTSKNSAHYKDMAIDVNIPGVGSEASNPEASARFDKLADSLTSAGYNVLWKVKGHDDHIHVQLGSSGVRGGFWKGGGDKGEGKDATQVSGTSPMTSGSSVTPSSGPSGSTGAAMTGASAMSGAGMSGGAEGQSTGPDQAALATLMNRMGAGNAGLVTPSMMQGSIAAAMGSILSNQMDFTGLAGNDEELRNSLMQLQPSTEGLTQTINQTQLENEAGLNDQQYPPQPTQSTAASGAFSQNAQNPTAYGYDYNHPDHPTSKDVHASWSERFFLSPKGFAPVTLWK